MKRAVSTAIVIFAIVVAGVATPATAQPDGSKPAFFTHFWDDFQPMASGKLMHNRAIASSYWPLGTKVRVGYGDNYIDAVVDDLGPADWVYEMHAQQHPNMAIIDLATPLMTELTGGNGNTEGWYQILEWGDGRTLYGFNASGYPGGPTTENPSDEWLYSEPEPEPEPEPKKKRLTPQPTTTASPTVAPTPSLAEPLSTEVDEVDEVEKRGFGFNGVLGIIMVVLGAFVATYIFRVVVKRSRSYEGKHRNEEE